MRKNLKKWRKSLSSLTKFVKGSVLLSIASVVVRLSGMLVLIPLARMLGAEQLGIYSLVFWMVQCSTSVGMLGVDVAMHRNGAKLYQTDPIATGRLLGTGTLLMGTSFTTLALSLWIWRLPLAEHWIVNVSATRWFGFAAVMLLLEGIGLIGMTLLLSLHRFREHSLATATGAFGRLLLSPLLALNYGLTGALLGLTLASFLQCITAWSVFWHTKKQYGIHLSCKGFWKESRDIFQFGMPFWAGNALIALLTIPIMGEIGRVAGVATLGQMRIAQSLSQIVNFLPGAIAPVAISVLSETYTTENDDREFRRLRSLHLRGNWLLALTLVVFLSITSRPLIQLLFGDAYQAAVPLVIGMGWVSLMVVIVENLNLYSLTAGNTGLIAIGSILQKVAFIGLTFWLIPLAGGIGFVISLFIGYVVQLLAIITGLWRNLEKTLKQNFWLLSLWSALIFGIVYGTISLNLPTILTLFISIIFSSINALVVILLVFTKNEKLSFQKNAVALINKRLKR
jgi:O-antigen/teichoic acid export membrane protein